MSIFIYQLNMDALYSKKATAKISSRDGHIGRNEARSRVVYPTKKKWPKRDNDRKLLSRV